MSSSLFLNMKGGFAVENTMRKTASLLLGSVAAVACLGTVQAAPVSRPEALSASSYHELLQPVPDAHLVLAADTLAVSSQPRPLLHLVQFHHHHHHHHSGFFPGAIIGGILGGMAAAPYYGGDEYDYGPPAYAAPPVVVQRGYGPSVGWCEQHYRSYNPETETYLGYDGRRHSCP